MKKTTIRYLVALGVMLGVGGCNAQETITTETVCGCKNTEKPAIMDGQEVYYNGNYGKDVNDNSVSSNRPVFSLWFLRVFGV